MVFYIYTNLEVSSTLWLLSQEMNESVRNHSFLNDFFNPSCQQSLSQWEVVF